MLNGVSGESTVQRIATLVVSPKFVLTTMQRIATLVASLLFVLTACGPRGEPPTESQAPVQATATESPDDAFDRALDDLTRAFFFHNPELVLG